jgi:hypothetical protein
MTEAITIRRATDADRLDVLRLAELDGGAVPRGDVLLAEANGELRAALGVHDGHAVSDPFEFTADTVELLREVVAREREEAQHFAPGAWLVHLLPTWNRKTRRA